MGYILLLEYLNAILEYQKYHIIVYMVYCL